MRTHFARSRRTRRFSSRSSPKPTTDDGRRRLPSRPEALSVKELAERFAEEFGCDVIFHGEEADTALLNDASRYHELYGEPRVDTDEVVELVAS